MFFIMLWQNNSCTSHVSILDGGRTIWEPVWHAAIERLQNKKSNLSGAETPLHSQSGACFGIGLLVLWVDFLV